MGVTMQPSLLIHKIALPHLARCAAIDATCTPSEMAWTASDFDNFFLLPSSGGLVALGDGRVVGFLLYQADRAHRRLHFVRIGVAPGCRGRGVGSRLVQHIRQWLRPVPDVKLCALVHERQLAVQCFLRANGFRAVRVSKGRYDDGANDGYWFELPVSDDLPIENRTITP